MHTRMSRTTTVTTVTTVTTKITQTRAMVRSLHAYDTPAHPYRPNRATRAPACDRSIHGVVSQYTTSYAYAQTVHDWGMCVCACASNDPRHPTHFASPHSMTSASADVAAARQRRDVVLGIIERGEVGDIGGEGDGATTTTVMGDGGGSRRSGGGTTTTRRATTGRKRRRGGGEAATGVVVDDDDGDDGNDEVDEVDEADGGEAKRAASGEGAGVRDAVLASATASIMTVNERAQAINELLSQRKIEVFRRGDTLVYARVREEHAAKFKGLSTEDMLVYQIIQHAGNAGMWTKELKARSNLPAPQITKIFKTLEARKLIKAVKHVAQQNRKVYMLFELEPSREITGGAWYTEQEYDAEFINVLREQCVKFIYSQEKVTLEEVSDFVRRSKLSHVELRIDDVLQIVSTLVYDGKVDKIEDESVDDGMADAPDEAFVPKTYYRKAALPIPESNAYSDIPCGVCPVINECRPDGLINPISCEYMTAWLDY